MTIAERIEKIEKIDNYLLGATLALETLNEMQGWPSITIKTAIGRIKEAQVALLREIHELKQMKQ